MRAHRVLPVPLSWNSTGKIGRIGRHLAEKPDVKVTMSFGPMPPDASDFPGGIPALGCGLNSLGSLSHPSRCPHGYRHWREMSSWGHRPLPMVQSLQLKLEFHQNSHFCADASAQKTSGRSWRRFVVPDVGRRVI